MPSVPEVAVEIALEEEKRGGFETSENRGPRIDEYSMSRTTHWVRRGVPSSHTGASLKWR